MARATDCVTTKPSGAKLEIHISENWSPREADGIETVASGIKIATTEDAVVNVEENDELNTAGASLVKTWICLSSAEPAASRYCGHSRRST